MSPHCKTAVCLAAMLAVTALHSATASCQEIVTLPTISDDEAQSRNNSAPARSTDKESEKPDTDEDTSWKRNAQALSRAFRHAAREATPSVVTVFSYGQNASKPAGQSPANEEIENIPPGDETLGPTPPQQSEEEGYQLTGLGSGVIVDLMSTDETSATQSSEPASPKIYWVMTNHHVVTSAQRVVIQLPDESELVAEDVYSDPDSDVAVLRIRTDRELNVGTFGDSDQLEIGDWVLAIGSPFKLEATVCAGIISAKNRGLEKIRRGRLFQTDAAINPGNSGGPLVDLDGNVIAISTAIATRNGGYQGIGFAIPINQAKWIARELAQYERVRRAAMGVRLAELNPKLAAKLKLPNYLGVLVYQVIKDSAADIAGLESLDVILEFAGQRVRRMSALQQAVEQQPVGSTQEIKILRKGKEITKQIVLAPLEDPTAIPVGDDTDDSESETANAQE
ncbi:S1C family serine protease [Aporhodopirellula aestuarii]|uniref:Trypsin-like peptidase domain-containing protein n=1 Tax=Aporhodopirellula aestuarii TaxID=2950107 RepID=A0ABT0UAP2_9BACT|nr:trypsin-like peptidase domain-containing protein [Aporhodopirellula aestuarii]MCM2373391.1 trypsin-like peptidase domain-containing protein [Aporhodopirellula aestuarii]